MKFGSAIIKLTIAYALIVMVISIGFSVAIYNISSQEIDNGLGRQATRLRELPIDRGNPFLDQIDQIQQDELEKSSNNLKNNLIYFNILILILSAGGSYLLARKTLRPIEETIELQHRFTADASHELKTPLTAMKSEIEVLLRDKNLTLPVAKNILRSNLEEIEKLEALSSALLKLSKLHGEATIEFSEIKLADILAEAFNKIASFADNKDIDFEFQSGNEGIMVKGDKTSLIELFVILFDNAIKYSSNHTKVSIKVSEHHESTEISIRDQGAGIRELDLSHIFDRFYRADQSRNKEKTDGYGLGLSIAKQIVDLHKGKISVESKPEKGSVFKVSLNSLNK